MGAFNVGGVRPVPVNAQPLACLACGAETTPDWREDMPPGSLGPRIQATVGCLAGRMGVSQRGVEKARATLLDPALALGSVSATEHNVSAALSQPLEKARTYVRQQPVTNADETSCRQDKQRRSLYAELSYTEMSASPVRGAL